MGVTTSVVSDNPTFEAIASDQRRCVLRLLADSESAVTEQQLAIHLASTNRRQSATGDTPTTVESVRTELRHIHLPKLAAVGMVNWDAAAGTVEPVSHSALDDPRFGLLLAADTEGLDAALAHVADNRRRIVLTILRDAETSMTRHDLAREFVRAGETAVEPAQDTVDDEVSALHHLHLPALDDAGFIEYDAGSGRATYVEHPALEEIFTIIYEPESHMADRYDGFLAGLGDATSALEQETSQTADWPHFWGDLQHG